MEVEELSKHFINTIFLLAKIQNLARDRFFSDKFIAKIHNFNLSFLSFVRGEDDITQYRVLAERCLADIDATADVLKEFRYLNIVKDTPLLLQAESALLLVKLEILKKAKPLMLEIGSKSSHRFEQATVHENTKVIRTTPKEIQPLTSSKKKIFDFIKSFPNTRTKDIIYEFNALSGRTVKRNLTDLLRAGLVKKRIDNKAVYYYV